MLIYYTFYILMSSFVGIVLMEFGQFGPDIGMTGYPNGASVIYLFHAILFFISFFVFQSFNKASQSSYTPINNREYMSIAGIVNCLLFSALLFLLFIAGAYQVWLGVIGKGEFRSTLGSLGAITYFLLYFIIPGSVALISIKFTFLEKKSTASRVMLLLAYGMAFLFGASWGFKSTAIQILLPGLCFMFWKIRIREVILLFSLSLTVFVLFAMIFDGTSVLDSIKHVIIRLTIVQGNIQWFIWDKFVNENIPEINYAKFLWASLGDTFINNYFEYPMGSNQWIELHYNNFVTQMIGYEDGGVSAGHNVQGGVFSEAVLWLGNLYFLLSIASGAIAGYVYGLIRKLYMHKQYVLASVLCTYYLFIIMGWANSGGIAVLVHIAILTEFIVALCFFKIITRYKLYIDSPIYR